MSIENRHRSSEIKNAVSKSYESEKAQQILDNDLRANEKKNKGVVEGLPLEKVEQKKFAAALRKLDISFFHIVNEGKANEQVGRELNRRGRRKGVSDIFIMEKGGIFIEMKRQHGVGSWESPSQAEFMIDASRNFRCYVARGCRAACMILQMEELMPNKIETIVEREDYRWSTKKENKGKPYMWFGEPNKKIIRLYKGAMCERY